MNLEKMLNISADPLSISTLLLNILIGFILSLAVRKHFRYFGSTLSNREEYARIFPVILLTTLLIITIVKSSLALSLGLVGALSIVRFRTPVKEPEELAYLFLSISIGLGLGANQKLATIAGSLSIMLLMAVISRFNKDKKGKSIYLSIDITDDSLDSSMFLERLNNIVSKHTTLCDLRRYDARSNSLEATYFLDLASIENLSNLTNELKSEFPSVGLVFLDQNQLPSL
jgi:hypothetical protein